MVRGGSSHAQLVFGRFQSIFFGVVIIFRQDSHGRDGSIKRVSDFIASSKLRQKMLRER